MKKNKKIILILGLVSSLINFNLKSQDLINAIFQEDIDTIQKLIPLSTASEKEAALTISCIQGYKEIVELLINNNVDANAKYSGLSPLDYSIKNDHYDIAELLIKQYNAKFSNNITQKDLSKAVTIAIENEDKLMIEFLLAQGANINLLYQNYTPLMLASTYGYTEIAKELINAGAYLNIQNEYGNTAIMLALNKKDMFELLLDAGADPTIKNLAGKNTINLSVSSEDRIKFLLNRGFKIDTVTVSEGLIALDYRKCSLNEVKFWGNLGANFNARNKALVKAIENNREDIVSLLIEYGVDIKDCYITSGNLSNSTIKNVFYIKSLLKKIELEADIIEDTTKILHLVKNLCCNKEKEIIIKILLNQYKNLEINNKNYIEQLIEKFENFVNSDLQALIKKSLKKGILKSIVIKNAFCDCNVIALKTKR